MSVSPGSASPIETVIKEYISKEIVSNPELASISNDTQLLVSGILDSLSLLKLVLFLEKHFNVLVGPEELVPENFATINAIRGYIQSKSGTTAAKESG